MQQIVSTVVMILCRIAFLLPWVNSVVILNNNTAYVQYSSVPCFLSKCDLVSDSIKYVSGANFIADLTGAW